MVSQGRLRVGVIGVGRLGREHARIYHEIDGVDLVGVTDTDHERSCAVADHLGVQAFPRGEDLLARTDAVSVVVPTISHAEVATAALVSGVDVLVEKPITATPEEGEKLVTLARDKGRTLAVGHVERYGPASRALLERVTSPRFIESHRLAPFNPRGTDVPVVLDLMIHDLDMLLALRPGDVARVDAVGVPVFTDTVDIANARLEFAGGLIANLTASRVSRDRLRKMRVFQAETYLSLDFMKQRLEIVRRRAPKEIPSPSFSEGFDPSALFDHEVLAPAGTEPLRLELEAFVSSLQRGEPPPVSGEDGVQALSLAHLIMKKMEGCLEATGT